MRIPYGDLARLRAALRRAGYHPHTGARFERKGELEAWARDLSDGKHVHVQVAVARDGYQVFAHTEAASGLGHVLSALTDGHSFSAGSRRLRQDLKEEGFVPSRAAFPRKD